ncbi:hypothetical protein K490DRAFT_61260 [Saccharata proteae CBS 121410]|uniref:DNA recombination and repair protein Rad51-like C-terminal domain-containing protein n=1 Tax=Saccharata proteae CBS 121410 TaxID=1314787 RepID=A0A9P4I334_9PEZI|nr:hypothetical protein K490DRAFT_61260 [Saccharata proteae CBS 121410]
MNSTLPVQPILASAIFSSLPKEGETGVKRKRIGTECGPVDDALRGGIGSGKGGMTCISGEKGSGRTALAFAFLTSHVLSSPSHQAVVIHTTGTFDVLRLYNAIEQRLRHTLTTTAIRKTANQELDPGFNPGARKPDAAEVEAEVQQMATAALDRVNIIRAFDFVGVVEAAGEVREKLETSINTVQQPAQPETTAVTVESKAAAAEQERRQRTEIADSQDDEEDEMLFDASTTESNPEALNEQTEKPDEPTRSPPDPQEAVDGQGKVGMIVIDNLAQVVSPMMKSNYTQAHALMTPFLRSLAHLMNTHQISTVIINAAVPPPRTTKQNPQQTPQGQALETHKPADTPSSPSIFASITSHPALGRSFPHHIDLHLFEARNWSVSLRY